MCTFEGFPFRVHASPALDGSIFVIKTLTDKHTCQVLKKNKLASSTWIASDCPDLDLKGMRSILRKRYGLSILTTKLYRVRCIAKGDIMETHEAEFIMVRYYAFMVLKTNPSSVAKIKSNLLQTRIPPVFQRLFLCFHGFVVGFAAGCKPFLEFDGYHLKGPYGVSYWLPQVLMLTFNYFHQQ